MRRTCFLLAFTLLAATPLKGETPMKYPTVVMKTSMGSVTIELYPDKAPATVKNFLAYVEDKFFDGTIFHRVISNFMIQGGGFGKDGKQKPTKALVKNEAANGLKNTTGTIAMARTSDPDSASAQFFINVADNAFLDRDRAPDGNGYCVFGKVIEGMDVVNKIKATPTKNGGGAFTNAPVTPVIIESIRVAP